MKELQDVVACVIDRGTFFPVAERLARDMKKVYYHRPNGESFETFSNGALPDGHDDVAMLDDFWLLKDKIDLFVFPDSNMKDVGTQYELERQGFPVWGSKGASRLEQMRGVWLEVCKELEMPMPVTHRIVGLTNLRVFLAENSDRELFVKISRWRGDMETWKASTPAQVKNKLDCLALKFGPFQEDIPFYVQEKLDTEIEGGCDTYFAAGQFPNKIILGYEKKSQSYFATWREESEMPEEFWGITKKIGPVLKQRGYCNMISSEVRFDGEDSYWLDPCMRVPSPAGEEELEWFGNFSEIVWRGANGELVQPEMTAKYFGEAVIQYDGDRDGWKSIQVPQEIKQWVKLYACGKNDEGFHYPPQQDSECIGTLVGMGDTPEEVVDHLKDLAEVFKDEPVNIHIEPLAALFSEIEEAKDEGIPFGGDPIPEPAIVLED